MPLVPWPPTLPSPAIRAGVRTLVSSSAYSMLQIPWPDLIALPISVSLLVIQHLFLLWADLTIAEDTVEASRRIPRSLLWSTSANALLCIIVAILICLCAGDVNALFSGPFGASGHPIGSIIQLTSNAARGNKALASAPFGLISPIIVMCVINTTAAASRMVFSFIRDDRNPYVQKVMASVSVIQPCR